VGSRVIDALSRRRLQIPMLIFCHIDCRKALDEA
jgi:hypothetical protein